MARLYWLFTVLMEFLSNQFNYVCSATLTLLPTCSVQNGIRSFWTKGGFRGCDLCDPNTGFWAQNVPCMHCCFKKDPVDPTVDEGNISTVVICKKGDKIEKKDLTYKLTIASEV